MLVGFKQPVIERQVLFNAGSSFLAWDDLSQTGHAYSAEEQHRARAVDLNVCAVAPHLELVSFRRMLFRELTFSLVFLTCSLQERVRSSVTPRQTGLVQCSRGVPDHVMLRGLFASRFLRWNEQAWVFAGFACRWLRSQQRCSSSRAEVRFASTASNVLSWDVTQRSSAQMNRSVFWSIG